MFPAGFHYKKASEPLYKTPKSIQETIEIMAVAENGIFEVSRNKYSKRDFRKFQFYKSTYIYNTVSLYVPNN